MASYNDGKDEIVRWICEKAKECSRILDVGACDGKWADLIRECGRTDIVMDACEIWKPNAEDIMEKYKQIFVGDIHCYRYRPQLYDLVIFGDVIEHMEVWKAMETIQHAKKNAVDHIIGVPFLYAQGELYGNPWEKHIQDDLTPEIFARRYPGHELILQPRSDYAYYHKKRE